MTTISLTPPVRPLQAAEISAQQTASAPASIDVPKPKGPSYFSPVVRIDPRTETAVWEVRDPQTGKVTQQFPREATINAYRAQSAETTAAPVVHRAGTEEPAKSEPKSGRPAGVRR